MPTNPKLVQLLDALLKATQEGRVHWEVTASKEAFRASLGDGMVRIGIIDHPLRRFNLPKEAARPEEFEAVLLDVSGREVDSVRQVPERPDLLSELYNLARRDALKVDDLIDHLLKSFTR